MQTTQSDIFQQGYAFAVARIQGDRQNFNGGKSNNGNCPYLQGSNFHKEWMNGLRSAEKDHNYDTGL